MNLKRSDFVIRWILTAFMLAVFGVFTSYSIAQDGEPIIIGQREKLKFFELESFRASVEAYWRYREDESKDSNGVTSHETESLLRESVILNGEGFFGNPNFVKLNIDIAFRLSQEKIENDVLNTTDRTSEMINEYSVNAVILQKSDFPLTVYSRRSQTLVDRQFASSLDSIITEHGAQLAIRSELMPSQFQYFHREQTQSGRFDGSNSELIQDTFTWHGRFKPINGHRAWWDYTFSNVDETNLLQDPNSFSRHDAIFNHTYDFGPDSKNNVRSSLRFFKETGKFPIDRIRWNETLRLEHSRTFETKYVYMFDQQNRRGSNQRLHRGAASFRHELFDSLTTTGQLGSSLLNISDDNFKSTQYFGDLGFKYQKIVPYGTLLATTDFRFNFQDDSDRGTSIQIIDEPHTFATSGLITLNRRNIVASSIVLTDAAGIVLYIEGIDYTVREFSDSVEIQRVLGGSIAPNESVLVRYEIGPEPESSTDSIGVGLTIRYQFEDGPLKGLSPYIRYHDQSQDRTSSSLIDLPQNDFQDLIFGIDYDIGKISFTAEHQIRDSTLSPFDRTRIEGSYTNRINNRNSFLLSAYYQETDRSTENLQSELMNLTARWNAQPTNKIKSSLVGTFRHEEDNKGTDSDAFEIFIDVSWRHRQTSVYATARNSIINGNSRESTSQSFLFGVRREF